MNTNNYKILNVPMPTFIQDIYRIKGYITMVCNKANIFELEDKSITEKNTDKSEDSHLNLTGNPLEVDLEDDGDIVISKQIERPKNWTKEEETYYPINFNECIDIQNKLKDIKKKELLFSLCIDNNTPRKTLLMGGQYEDFQRYLVTFLGCCTLDQEQVLLSTLKERHLRNCMPYEEMDERVCILYPIIGHKKHKGNDLADVNIKHSAFIETTCDEATYEWTYGTKQKLFLQINLNNSDALCYPLLENLNQINALFELLEDDDIDKAKISDDPVPLSIIVHKVMELVNTTCEAITIPAECDILNWAELNVDDMRPKNILEKLWLLLISLESIEEVRECFHTLFQVLADSSLFRLPISNVTTIGDIMKHLSTNTIAVPTLTLQATLKYLIELGLNKLFNDYLFIIQNMGSKLEHFNDAWREILQEANVPALANLNARKSRLFVCRGIEDTGSLKGQMNYIAHMHLVAEFMQMVRKCGLNPETVDHCFDQIIKYQYRTKSFQTLKQESIVDFECDLHERNIDLIKKLSPVSINVKFSTKTRNCLVITIFHFSDMPIFPDNIFNDYDFDMRKTDGKQYYVHQAAYHKTEI